MFDYINPYEVNKPNNYAIFEHFESNYKTEMDKNLQDLDNKYNKYKSCRSFKIFCIISFSFSHFI